MSAGDIILLVFGALGWYFAYWQAQKAADAEERAEDAEQHVKRLKASLVRQVRVNNQIANKNGRVIYDN